MPPVMPTFPFRIGELSRSSLATQQVAHHRHHQAAADAPAAVAAMIGCRSVIPTVGTQRHNSGQVVTIGASRKGAPAGAAEDRDALGRNGRTRENLLQFDRDGLV